MSNSIFTDLKRLLSHIFPKFKNDFFLLFLLIFSTSLAEFFSIGLLIPFLSLLISPDRIFTFFEVNHLHLPWLINNVTNILLFVTVIFVFFTLISAFLRICLIRYQTKLAFSIGSYLSLNVYKKTLYQPYEFHTNKNTSEIISSASYKAEYIVHGIVLPLITILSASLITLAILVILYLAGSALGLFCLIFFGFIYYFISKATKDRLKRSGLDISKEQSNTLKILQEGLGAIRDIIIDNNQRAYYQIYKDAEVKLRKAQTNVLFISSSPRYIIEASAMICIASAAYVLAISSRGLIDYLPILGLLVLAAQRMLPMLQQIYGGYSQIRASAQPLNDVLNFLDVDSKISTVAHTSINTSRLSFQHLMKLDNVSFSYSSRKTKVLDRVCLEIFRGDRIGLIGSSGSGKSTLLDIIMSLLSPSEGYISVDGTIIDISNQNSWRNNISHVPQSIYLTDASIYENIAFGLRPSEIDRKRVIEVAAIANISKVIESWPDGFDTIIGERGINLSGGQRQRIGIARALYKKSTVIIFDEATSALDYESEKEIMECIYNLGDEITLIMTAHRLNSLSKCTKIIELEHGQISRMGTYREIIEKNKF